MKVKLKKVEKIKGEIEVPGDKSISHRSLIFGAISEGKTEIKNLLKSADCLSTLGCLRNCGIKIEVNNTIIIYGNKFKEPEDILDCGNSGTTMRLLSGVLASKPFLSILTGDNSLRKRPMRRIIEPLSKMGAFIIGREENLFAPLVIKGRKLKGINYKLPVASAQVKSCIILASLFSEGETVIEEPYQTRDHTERMLKYFGGRIEKKGTKIFIPGTQKLYGKQVFIPGDFSSASYFIAIGLLVPGSEILIKNLGLNPTRTYFLKIIERMGGKVEIIEKEKICEEEIGTIRIRHTEKLKGTEIRKEEVPLVIDEIPLIGVIASVSKGKTVVSGAKELRYKESDRIKAIVSELKKLGSEIYEKEDGFEIYGIDKLKGNTVNSWNDHRIAMCLTVAGLIAEGETTVEDADCINISFPQFYDILSSLKIPIQKKTT